jgi:hypothetical protein
MPNYFFFLENLAVLEIIKQNLSNAPELLHHAHIFYLLNLFNDAMWTTYFMEP